MKLPKTLIIAGKTYRLIADNTIKGGLFRCGAQEIRVDPSAKGERLMEILAHEIIEAIFTNRDMRYCLGYNDSENGDLLFSFNHEQFEQAVKDIAFALKPFLKE